MNFFRKINNKIEKIESALLIFFVLFMVIVAFLQIILRNVFDHGFLWADILPRQMVLWVGFLGASIATREEKHINIDVFSRFIKGRSKPLIQALVSFFATYVSWLLLIASWGFIKEEITYETPILYNIPSWYFQIIIPVGFALMAFRFMLLGIEKAYSGIVFKKESEE